jgi:hypothetical protein
MERRVHGESVRLGLTWVPVLSTVGLMAYTEFSLESVESAFGLTSRPAELFPGLRPIAVPDWLRDYLSRGQQTAALVSEKARSEFLVVPILMAAHELTTSELSIYSGQRLDVDPDRGLVGECDYILALTPPVPRLKAPLITVLQAKKGDLESALGQCVAQMMGARIFNERADQGHLHLYGCVTSGEVWQFLRLDGSDVEIDRVRFFLDNVGGILAAIQMILMRAQDLVVSGPSPAAAV